MLNYSHKNYKAHKATRMSGQFTMGKKPETIPEEVQPSGLTI